MPAAVQSDTEDDWSDDPSDGSEADRDEDDQDEDDQEQDQEAEDLGALLANSAGSLVMMLGHPASRVAEQALQLLLRLQPVVDVAKHAAQVRGQMGLAWALATSNLLQAAAGALDMPGSSDAVVMACRLLKALGLGPRMAAEVANHVLLPGLLLRLLCSSNSSLIQPGLELADVAVLPRRQVQQAVLGMTASASSTTSGLVVRLVELAAGAAAVAAGSGSRDKHVADSVSNVSGANGTDDQAADDQQALPAELMGQVVTALRVLRYLATGNVAVQRQVAGLPDVQLRTLLGLLGAAERAVADEAAEALCVLRQGDDDVRAKWSSLGQGVRVG